MIRVDEHVRALFGAEAVAHHGVRLLSLHAEGLGLRARFAREGSGEVEVLLQPAGKARRFAARLKAFDVLVVGKVDEWEDSSRPSLVRDVVEILGQADVPTTMRDWVTTVGEEADARFMMGEVAEIKLTARCDQRCVFCKSPSDVANLIGDEEELERALPRLALRTRYLTLSGGETLLSERLDTYIGMARDAGFEEVEIQTNGMKLAEPGRVKRLMEAGVTNALISLHADNESLSDMLTGTPGGFRRTIDGIDRCLEHGLEVCLCHVICEGNFKELPAYASFIRERFDGYPVTVVFTLAIPTFRVRDDPGLMPRLSEAGPLLKQALERFESACEFEVRREFKKRNLSAGPAGGIDEPDREWSHIATVIRQCGLPACVLGDLAHYHQDILCHDQVPANEEMAHPAECDRCAYRNRCVGLWRTYIDRFGADGIDAVRTPLPPRVERLMSLAAQVA